MHVLLKHSLSGKTKRAATGWSWPLFFAAGGLMGIPLFFRGLALWGSAVLVLWSLRLMIPLVVAGAGSTAGDIDWIFAVLLAGLSAFVGLKGNALIARRYLLCGYDFARPESVESRLAAESWGVRPSAGTESCPAWSAPAAARRMPPTDGWPSG